MSGPLPRIPQNGRSNKGAPIVRPKVPPPAPPVVATKEEEEIKNGEGDEKLPQEEEDEFDDSDFCDSDSELIRNFVSQVQPIYSMEEEPLYQYYSYGISLKV